MGKKIKQEKGITVVALVITIIVLLILAAISIATLTGENGILTKARKAKEETKIAEYKEALELIGIGLQQEKVMGKLSSEEYMKNYANKIENDDKFKDSNVILNTEKNPITIQVITKEGYVYLITEDKVEVMGKEGETAPPDLQESDVTFTYEPTDWTNGSVEVKIETEITGYTLQYSTDGTKWTNYTEKVTKKDNGVIYARLINNLDEVGGYATGNVENIDRLVPNSFTPTATSTTNSITLTGSTTDAEKTEIDGCSGINKYYFSKDNGSTWEPSGGKTGTNYTFTGLTQNKSYSLKMKAVDKAGNETITSTVSKSTEGVPGLTESNTTFTYSPSTPTNGNVAVTITTTAGSEYTLQYSTDGTTWKDYTTAITMTQNGEIYARVKDSTGQVGGTATGNVTNIDKISPTAATINLSNTSVIVTTPITAKVTHNDNDSGVKISSCKWIYNTTNTELGTDASKYTGGTFTSNGQTITLNATTVGTYYLHVLTIDNAGNTRETISSAVTVTNALAKQANIGEYVAYNATNNYSYTSPKGTGSSHGNGSASQTFKSSSSIKWRILSKDETTGEVVLISETPIGDFTLNGAIGYLYAEEELNRICSIYGHGTGANTDKTFTCQTGDTVEGLSTVTLTGSGARSINVDDINKICGVTPSATLYSKYGKSYTHTIFYPTITTTSGKSSVARSRRDIYTYYTYSGSTYLTSESDIYKILYRNVANSGDINYWLASRCIGSYASTATFNVRYINERSVYGTKLFQGYSSSIDEATPSKGVRTVVYLKTNIQTRGKDSSGAWIMQE